MSALNTTFAGDLVHAYDEYLAPLIFDEYARDLAGRTTLPRGAAVLEMAAGTGVLTRQLGSRLPAGAAVTATDINADMLAVAEASLAGESAVSFRTADANDLPFADRSFDAVFCQFGVMFFPDKARSYREAARVLRPGGVFVFSVWDSLAANDLPRLVDRTVAELLPSNPPDFLSVPYGYHDLTAIHMDLEAAGFSGIDIAVSPGVSRAPSARNVMKGFVTGTPLSLILAERGILDAAKTEVETAIVSEFGSGEVSAPMQAISFVARKS